MANMDPAWTWGDDPSGTTPFVEAAPFLESATPEDIFGGSTGRGVKVAIVDSGVDNTHPAVAGAVRGWVEPDVGEQGVLTINTAPHEDVFGHGTACAGVVHRIAPEAELYSVRVLGAGLVGRARSFAEGLRWTVENGMHVVNLSLGTTIRDYFYLLYELVDQAYYRGTVLVTAANNMRVPSAPSLYASVVSVACYHGASDDDVLNFWCNPSPPVEFGAPGINVRVGWLGGSYITATGNSFAAPHITGLVALLRSKHPHLTPFEVKTLLRALARNARRTVPGTQDLRSVPSGDARCGPPAGRDRR
jgi:subtilisin